MATARIILPTPHTAQRTVMEEARRYNVLDMGRRWGKLLGLNTPIPTKNGLKLIKDIEVGDWVFGLDGAPKQVLGLSDIFIDRSCYKLIFGNGETVVADAEHPWYTITKLSRKAATRTDRPPRKNPPPLGALRTTQEIYATQQHKKESNHSIPLAGPLQYPHRELPLDPYCLGAWLGDGSKNGGQITGLDREIFENFESAGFILGSHHRIKSQVVLGLVTILRKIGVINNKHIPHEYLYGDIEQRLALLQGLMDTDGYVDTRGQCFFDNTNESLAHGVYTLVQSLGCKATIQYRRATLYGKDCGPSYRVFFRPSFTVFRLTRKIERQKTAHPKSLNHYIQLVEPCPSEPVRCLQVEGDDGLFLITESCIATHNSTLGIDRLIRPALQGYPVAWFAPEDKFYEEVWRELVNTLQPVITYKNTNKRRIDLIGGGAIEVWNMARPQNVARGRKYKRVCVDEAAQIPELEKAWQQAIRATLWDFRGDAWFFSTPRGFNFFYRLYMLGQEADKKIALAKSLGEPPPISDVIEWKSWRMPSYTNPHLPPEEVEKMRHDLTPKNFSQEVEALFLGEGTSVFPYVEERSIGQLRMYIPSHQYAIGVDWGREDDYTVFSIMDISTKSEVWLEITSKIEFHHQRDRLKALAERYHPSMILCEMNSMGVPNFEELQREGLPVTAFWTSNGTKAEAVDAMVLALSRQQITLLDKDQYTHNIPVGAQAITEMHSYASNKLPSGQTRYAAPEGAHDDYVMARMLSWMCCITPENQAFHPTEIKGALSDHTEWAL